MAKEETKLNSRTPNWFKEWHGSYFERVDARTKRNERWLYVIITALIATSVIGDNVNIDVVALLEALLG